MTRTPQKAPFSVFLAATVVIFFLALSAADSIGFVPFYIDGSEPSARDSIALSNLPQLGAESADTHGVDPERIKIDAINLDLAVQNPATRDLAVLDALLQKGPARYVDSARLDEKGNMIIFAHSSHLPIVHNQMFKAFNRIPELKAGDSISITGGGKEFVYQVVSVTKEDTSHTIDLSKTGQHLTLVTCDTLTGKSARFVLQADFVGSYSL